METAAGGSPGTRFPGVSVGAGEEMRKERRVVAQPVLLGG